MALLRGMPDGSCTVFPGAQRRGTQLGIRALALGATRAEEARGGDGVLWAGGIRGGNVWVLVLLIGGFIIEAYLLH